MIVKELGTHKLCRGVNATEQTGKLFHHVIPLDDEGEDASSGKDDEIGVQFTHKGYWRAKGCWLVCDKEGSECASFTDYMEYVKNASKEIERRLSSPVHVKAPVSKTDPERIKLTVQGQRLRCGEREQGLK